MIFRPSFGFSGRLSRAVSRSVVLLLWAIQVLSSTSIAALPKRLILALDGVSYRDMKALQEGVTYKDAKGRPFHRQGFRQGYFPVSRMVSTFPSTSDVAWTEIFGDRPLPGYQRTYYSEAANAEIVVNGVTTSMEHERQMHWQVESSYHRAMAYVFPRRTFNYEVHELIESFLNTRNGGDNYYAYVRSTDDGQHLSADILAMLCMLDEKLQELRARYKAQEGRELEILILSDHGNNHAGPAKRVEIRTFLKKAGYRITNSILGPKDVVLPTVGVESWVEIHNSPGETERLAQLLTHLDGVDVLTARVRGEASRFLVMNAKGERASIEWNSAKHSFRYSTETGDPIKYRPVVESLSRKNQLDAEGFATAEAWMAETLDHRYPLAPERIARGHTRVTLNPATILISLNNHYVHASWLTKKGSEMVRFGGTHGGLDDLNSNGILLSSFAPTQDTATSLVAAVFDGFQGLREYRAEENGAEWLSGKAQDLTTITRGPVDWGCRMLSSDGALLRIWTPSFVHLGSDAPVDVTIAKAGRFLHAQIRRGDPEPIDASEKHLTLNLPLSLPGNCSYERIYALPPDLMLEPQKAYWISGRLRDGKKNLGIFKFAFRTDIRGLPAAY
ncbi:MAG: alkaline phosphatase family protein [Limisphaerales bacterium]